jgi:hypothetical protein
VIFVNRKWGRTGLALGLAVLAVAAAGCTLPGGLQVQASPPFVVKAQTNVAAIDWVDFIKVKETMYTSLGAPGGRQLTEADLGPVHATVRFQLEGNVRDPNYKAKDGDAAFLAPGTQIRTVKGYDPKFRLAVLRQGQVVLYEAENSPAAKTGADLYDLEGKVATIGIGSAMDGSQIAEIKDPAQVDMIVKAILAAPVIPEKDRTGEAMGSDLGYFLILHFQDGTVLQRSYWPKTGFLWPGFHLPESVAQVVTEAAQGAGGPGQ